MTLIIQFPKIHDALYKIHMIIILNTANIVCHRGSAMRKVVSICQILDIQDVERA